MTTESRRIARDRTPPDYRPAIVFQRAQAVAQAVTVDRRALPTVRLLHEVLAIGPASLDS